MALDLATVNRVLAGVSCPGGGDLLSRDLVRALSVEGEAVRFVLEAASADEARALAWTNAAPGTMEAWLGTLRAHVSLRGLRPTLADRLDELGTNRPSLSILFGSADPVIPASHVHEVEAVVRNASICVVPGLGHVPHREAPIVVAQWLRDVLAADPRPIEPYRALAVVSGFRAPWYRRAARAIGRLFGFGRPALGA